MHPLAALPSAGKYALFVMAGFQRYASGILVLEIATEEVVGFMPAPGGHHDIALVRHVMACMLSGEWCWRAGQLLKAGMPRLPGY